MANFQEDLINYLYKHKDSNNLIEINSIIKKHSNTDIKIIRDIVVEYENKKLIKTNDKVLLLGQLKNTLDNTQITAMLTPVDGINFANTHYIKSWSEKNTTLVNIIVGIVSGVIGALISTLIQQMIQ